MWPDGCVPHGVGGRRGGGCGIESLRPAFLFHYSFELLTSHVTYVFYMSERVGFGPACLLGWPDPTCQGWMWWVRHVRRDALGPTCKFGGTFLSGRWWDPHVRWDAVGPACQVDGGTTWVSHVSLVLLVRLVLGPTCQWTYAVVGFHGQRSMCVPHVSVLGLNKNLVISRHVSRI